MDGRSALVEHDDARFDCTGRHLRQLRARYGWAGLVVKVEDGQITRVDDMAVLMDIAAHDEDQGFKAS